MANNQNYQKQRNQRNQRNKEIRRKALYARIGIIVILIVAVIFVMAVLRSCGADTEKANTANSETSENGAYTEDEITATTEPDTTETPATDSPTTETLAIEGVSTEEETTNHDIPDLSGLEFPFTTMSLDWGEDDLEGWYHYDIPEEYVKTGGYFPDAVQVYTYALCTQNGIDYPTVLALIEVESGYKYDAVSKSGAMGYMQVVPSLHSERLGNPLSDEAFINPYMNIDAGIDYLCELYERFESNEMVLTAYHYGVTGAYRDYWNNGEAGSPYSDEVLEIAERIRDELYGE